MIAERFHFYKRDQAVGEMNFMQPCANSQHTASLEMHSKRLFVTGLCADYVMRRFKALSQLSPMRKQGNSHQGWRRLTSILKLSRLQSLQSGNSPPSTLHYQARSRATDVAKACINIQCFHLVLHRLRPCFRNGWILYGPRYVTRDLNM